MTQREFLNIIINGRGEVTDKNEDGTKAGSRAVELMIDGAINPEITAYAQLTIDKMSERNANRKTSKSELAKAEKRNELADKIYDLMENDRTYTCGEVATIVNEKTQVLTPIFDSLVKSGRVSLVENYKPAKGKSRCRGYVKN